MYRNRCSAERSRYESTPRRHRRTELQCCWVRRPKIQHAAPAALAAGGGDGVRHATSILDIYTHAARRPATTRPGDVGRSRPPRLPPSLDDVPIDRVGVWACGECFCVSVSDGLRYGKPRW